MVEKDSIKEAPSTLGQPASSEQSLTLQALQKEIDYHRRHDTNATYVEKALTWVHNGAADELAQLELDYKTEAAKANSISREQVIKDVTADQKALGWQDTTNRFTSNLTNMVMATVGKRWSFIATGLTTALDTMHPNDTFGNQVVEGICGFGLGYGTGKAVNYGWNMENKILGMSLGSLAFPVVRAASHGGWPNEGYGEKPDVEKLFEPATPMKELPPPGAGQNPAPSEAIPQKDSKPDTEPATPAVDNSAYWKQFHS